MDQPSTSVSEWLQARFEAWRYQPGIRKTLTEFAAFVGISEENMLSFLDGSGTPRGANLAKLGATLGFELFELVGIQPVLLLDSMPHFFKISYAMAFIEYYETITAQGMEKDSPDARLVLEEMFKKYHLAEAFISDPIV